MEKRLTRSITDCKIAGVCGGFADYFGWDPTLVRVVYILATVFTAFAGFWAYILMWIVMPTQKP